MHDPNHRQKGDWHHGVLAEEELPQEARNGDTGDSWHGFPTYLLSGGTIDSGDICVNAKMCPPR